MTLRPTDAWAITDIYGEIQTVSREARELLGLVGGRGGENLLQLFADYAKAVVSDIETAMTGWPTGRTLPLPHASGRISAVHYRVSRRLDTDRVELFWLLHREEYAGQQHCA
jgi:hypothetical protein